MSTIQKLLFFTWVEPAALCHHCHDFVSSCAFSVHYWLYPVFYLNLIRKCLSGFESENSGKSRVQGVRSDLIPCVKTFYLDKCQNQLPSVTKFVYAKLLCQGKELQRRFTCINLGKYRGQTLNPGIIESGSVLRGDGGLEHGHSITKKGFL